jgi:hypothetical protein
VNDSTSHWIEAIRAPVVWLTVRRASADGRACRDYVVYDAAGARLAGARAFPWRREIPIFTGDDAASTVILLRRRRFFPLSGKVDVHVAGAGARIGVVSRGGRFTSADGRVIGAFRDARPMRDRTKEAVVIGLLDAMAGGDGSSTIMSGPTGFIYFEDGSPAGSLARARLPFEPPGGEAGGRHLGRLRALLPARFASALVERGGWKLERAAPSVLVDPRLLLAAALFAVELSHW